ncbi:sensor domain-containing diguanylate cyclase [Massilia endophytica]|uniref:sensor domain-containing diguanylate cyclase n=1 Tax=Massilia endophytica TaxID=2899220 RepID=UPI001E2BBFB7|nr:diguanylate cyclase [Massilia endophytica]UGQ44619.1 diguanylate cyclase [Massilia endophytica]
MTATTTTVLRLVRKMYRAILLPGFTLVLLASMWAAVAWQIGQEQHSAHIEAVLHAHAQARTMAENASHLLRQTDHATQLFKLKFEETEGALRLPEFTRRNGLLDSLMPSKLQLPIALYGPDGQLLDSLYGSFPASVGERNFFRTLGASSADLALVTNPMVDPLSKKWQIQISRRLNDRKGGFAGAVVMMVDPAYFVEDYDRLHLESGGMMMLLSRDTGLSTGRVDDTLFISDNIDFVPSSDQLRLPEEVLLKRPFDAMERIYSFREMPRYGLTAVVGINTRHAMARFERRRSLYFGAVTAASLLVLAFAVLLFQQGRRLRNSSRIALEAQQQLRAAADASLDAVFLLKACRSAGKVVDFTLVDVNERGAQMLGYPRAAALGKRIGELEPAWRSEGFIDKYCSVLTTGQPLEEEFETRNLPGEPRWLRHQIVAIEDGVTVTTRNITPRKLAELAMRQNQAELAAVNDASPLGLLRADRFGHCTYVNRTFETITGMSRALALHDGWMQGVHPNDRELLRNALEQLRSTHQPFQDTVRCVHPDGTLVWTSVKIAPIVVDGRIEGYVGTLDDITVVRKSLMALRESEARLRTIADSLPAMIAYIDFDEIFRFQNVAYEREFSVNGEPPTGHPVREVVSEERYRFLQPYIRRALKGETLSFEEEDDSGPMPRTFEVVYIPQMDADGITVIGYHVMRQDVTAQKREKQRLLKLSQIDALTGLTNRAGFLQKLGESMIACREQGSTMAIMYMDIDRFKPVNDTYGHSVGDALLRAFSGRLTHALRGTDTVARLGGDEFTIIMERIARREDAAATAAKIVSAMQAPFDLDGIKVSISTSIGLTFYSNEDMSSADLLKRADVLLYEAKQAGRNTFRSGPALAPEQAAPDAA